MTEATDVRYKADIIAWAGRHRLLGPWASTTRPSCTNPAGAGRRPPSCPRSGQPARRGCHHGVSEELYLRDPDENGVELYWVGPPDVWPRTPQGELAMYTRRLDLNGLLKEIEPEASAPKVGEGLQDL